jgi:hypothetical protein
MIPEMTRIPSIFLDDGIPYIENVVFIGTAVQPHHWDFPFWVTQYLKRWEKERKLESRGAA